MNYIVLYHENSPLRDGTKALSWLDSQLNAFCIAPGSDLGHVGSPLVFSCVADDPNHAEEQCENAYPGCKPVWVAETDDVNVAFQEYWNWGV